MGILLLKGEGYEYCDKERGFLFSEDGTHRYLFDYVSTDISSVPFLVDEYCSAIMDLNTFELIPGAKGDNELAKIESVFESAHPYYQLEYERCKAIVCAIGEYFIDLLVNAILLSDEPIIDEDDVDDDWFKEKMKALIPDGILLQVGEKYLDDFYSQFKYRMDNLDIPKKYKNPRKISIPECEPTFFPSQISGHRIISNMLYFILDVDAKDIKNLSTEQRVWLYENIFGTGLDVVDKLPFGEQDMSTSGETPIQKKEKNELKKKFKSLNSSLKLAAKNVVHNGIPENAQEQIASAAILVNAVTQAGIPEAYEINDLRQLIFVEIRHMIQNKTEVRACKNCAKYFIVSSRKVMYCDRLDESGNICSKVGSNNTFKKMKTKDEAYTIYSREYQTRYAHVKRGKMEKGEFFDWSTTAREKLDQVRAGEYDLEEFREWLKNS